MLFSLKESVEYKNFDAIMNDYVHSVAFSTTPDYIKKEMNGRVNTHKRDVRDCLEYLTKIKTFKLMI